MTQESTELVQFNEQEVLKFSAAQLEAARSGEVVVVDECYLATDVYQGEQGVASFGIVLPYPEPRPFYFIAEEGPAGSYDEEITNRRVGDDPIRRLHYMDTDRGFAVVRVTVAPEVVVGKLRQDRFLGPAVIDKCCEEGTVPAEFDEELQLPVSDALGHEKNDQLTVVEERLMTRLREATGMTYRVLREYPSWHGYRMYAAVSGQIAEGCRATVANFDTILAMLAKDTPKLHDFESGELVEPTAALELPPACEV